MIRLLFILTLLASSAQASDLDGKLFDYLCKGGAARRKVEVSWTAKVDSQAGQRLDIAQEKQEAQRVKIQKEARERFAKMSVRYSPDQIQDYVSGGKLDEVNLSTYLANQFVLMVPQKDHVDVYDEGCLPHYGENQFLGYRDGEPVVSALVNNQVAIWGCYALRNTLVQQEDEKFTARLDLNGFCKYARPADSFLAK